MTKHYFHLSQVLKITTTLLIISFLTLSTNLNAQSCADNLLQNPGFESGSTNWGGGSSITNDAYTGLNAIQVCTGQQTHQLRPVDAGVETYTFSFWAKNSSSTTQGYGRLKYLNSSYQPVGNSEFAWITSTDYSSYSIDNDVPADAVWVEVTIKSVSFSTGCTLADELCLNSSGGGNNGGGGGGGNTTCSNNVLQNSGFENAFSNWNGNGLASSTTASAGSNSLKLCGNGLAYQTLPYTDGDELTLFFESRTEGGSNSVLSYIKYLSASWQPLVTEFNSYSNTVTFTEVSFSKSPPAGTAHVQVGFINNATNCFLIDEVCLSKGGGGNSGGECSFIKTYFPYEVSSGLSNPQPLSQTTNSLSTWVFEPSFNGSASEVKSVTSDLSGNFISETTTPIPNGFINYDQTIQNTDGDYILIRAINGLPNFQKINADGTEAWSTVIDQFTQSLTNGRLFPTSIIADGTGYIAAFGNSLTSNPQIGEVILIKVDANGNFQWLNKTEGLGITYPQIKIFELSDDAIYANITTGDGNNIYKFNRSNGNLIWASPAYSTGAGSFYRFQGAVLTSNNEIAVVWRQTSPTNTYIRRISASSGAFQGPQIAVSDYFNETTSFPIGLLATDDGGLIYSGGFGAFFNGGAGLMNKYFKLDADLNLVWDKDLPDDWRFSPKQIAADGGILFVGTRGNDLAFLKTTSTGERMPSCEGECAIADIEISNIQCDDSGTPTEPLDDTYSFSVLVTGSSDCSGSTWTSGSFSGSYGVPKTISGLLILDGTVPVSFADASNPSSTVFSVNVETPSFCSDQGTGCGFEKTYNNSISNPGFQPPFAENLPNGGFSISTQFGSSSDYQELILDETGTEVSYTIEEVTGKRFRTLDDNYITAEFVNDNSIEIKKTNATGSNTLFSNTISISILTNTFFSGPSIIKIVPVSDGYVIAGTYGYQQTPNQAPEQVFFAIKTDLNGNKIFQSQIEVDNYPYFYQQFLVGDSGNFYYLISSSSTYFLYKFNESGSELWSEPVLGDFPSSDFIDLHEAADGNFYVTRYDNSFGYVRKLDAMTGNTIWQYSSAALPIPNNSTIYGGPDGSLSTPDGGAVFSMRYSIPGSSESGYVIGRLSKNGQLIWHRILPSSEYYDHRPTLVTADGGYLFTCIQNGEYSVFKTTSTGELDPNCTNGGGGNLADLTLTNLNLGSASITAGQLLNYDFDLKNIGTATTGSYNIKAYISTDTQLSSNDIQDGTIPTGNLAPNTTISDVPGASTIPSNLAPGNYFLILKVDADNQITESNESNNVLTSLTPFTVMSGGGNGPDLDLTLSASPLNPGQWKSSDFSLVIKNTGTVAATGVKVDFMNQSDPSVSSELAYQGHNAPSGTSFNSWNGIWTVGTLAPGQTLTLTYKAFCKVNTVVPVFTQITSASPTDSDSSPGNNNNGIPSEDDEALVEINSSANSNASGFESEESNRVQFIVYPNPVGERLNVRFAKSYPVVELNLVNNLGISMMQQTIEEPKDVEQLDMSSIPNGQYFLNVVAPDTKAQVRKVVVLRTY